MLRPRSRESPDSDNDNPDKYQEVQEMELTQDQLRDILNAAVMVAEAAPLKGGQYVFAAKIPWNRIKRLREALDAAGIAWKGE